jgi:hypothetical protein
MAATLHVSGPTGEGAPGPSQGANLSRAVLRGANLTGDHHEGVRRAAVGAINRG